MGVVFSGHVRCGSLKRTAAGWLSLLGLPANCAVCWGDLRCLSTISIIGMQTGRMVWRRRQIGSERLEPVVTTSPRTSDVEDSSRALPCAVVLDPAPCPMRGMQGMQQSTKLCPERRRRQGEMQQAQ